MLYNSQTLLLTLSWKKNFKKHPEAYASKFVVGTLNLPGSSSPGDYCNIEHFKKKINCWAPIISGRVTENIFRGAQLVTAIKMKSLFRVVLNYMYKLRMFFVIHSLKMKIRQRNVDCYYLYNK